MAEDEKNPESPEVKRHEMGRPERREAFPAEAALEMPEEDLRARQAAMGEHRRYAGPVFHEPEILPAAMDPNAAEEDVEPTEVAPESAEAAEEPEASDESEY